MTSADQEYAGTSYGITLKLVDRRSNVDEPIITGHIVRSEKNTSTEWKNPFKKRLCKIDSTSSK